MMPPNGIPGQPGGNNQGMRMPAQAQSSMARYTGRDARPAGQAQGGGRGRLRSMLGRGKGYPQGGTLGPTQPSNVPVSMALPQNPTAPSQYDMGPSGYGSGGGNQMLPAPTVTDYQGNVIPQPNAVRDPTAISTMNPDWEKNYSAVYGAGGTMAGADQPYRHTDSLNQLVGGQPMPRPGQQALKAMVGQRNGRPWQGMPPQAQGRPMPGGMPAASGVDRLRSLMGR
jgi:hypothetical protein